MSLLIIMMSGCSDTPERLFERADQRFKEKDWVGALIYFQDFMKEFPDDPLIPEAMQALAACHFQLGEFEESRQLLNDVLAKYPDDEYIQNQTKLQIGWIYYRENKLDEGRRYYEDIVNASVTIDIKVNAYDLLAQGYIMDASFPEARKTYEDTIAWIVNDASKFTELESDPNQVREQFLFKKANTWFQEHGYLQDQANQAAAAVQSATGFIPAGTGTVAPQPVPTPEISKDAIFEGVKAFERIAADEKVSDLMRAQALFQAADVLDRAYRGDDNNAILTGEAHDRVLNAYRTMYETYPDNDYSTWARVEAARILRDDGKHEEANALFAEAIKRYEEIIANPIQEDQQRWAMSKVGDAYLRMENLKGARDAFYRLYRSYPDDQQYAPLAQARIAEFDGILGQSGITDATAPVDAATNTVSSPSQ